MKIFTLLGLGVILVVSLNKLEEDPGPVLLKESHEGGGNGLTLGGGELGDLLVTVDIAATDLLELEVAGDIGVDQDVDQILAGHHELGNHIHIVVTISSEALGRGGTVLELLEELQIKKREKG